MALIKLIDESKARIVTPSQAAELWKVLNGEIDGTEAQQAFALRVKDIYMDWRHPSTPKSYLERYRSVFSEKAIDQGIQMEALPETDLNINNAKDKYGERL